MRTYKIIDNDNKVAFQSTLNTYIQDGWILEPGSFHIVGQSYFYYTALLSIETKKLKERGINV